MFEKYSDLLSIPDLQSALKISRPTAYHLIKTGQIPHLRIGRKIKIPKALLVDYITNPCYTGCIAASKLTDQKEVIL